jgi:hypothetical protein
MSESSGKFLGMNRTEGIGTAAAAAWVATFPQAVSSTVHGTAGFVNEALEFGAEWLSGLWSTMLWAAVAPVAWIASGIHIWNRIADIGGLAEDAAMRKYLKWGWWAAGLLLSASPALPYMIWGSIASKLWAKPFKWAAGKVWQAASAVVSTTVGTPLSALKSIPWNAQAGWNWGK